MAGAMLDVLRVWTGWRPDRLFALGKRLWTARRAERIRRRWYRAQDLIVPPMLILSITMRCNLACPGCYSRGYPRDDEMTTGEIESLFKQAGELGVAFFVITGGEPLLRDDLLPLLARHPEFTFFLFTNATRIGSEQARRLHRQRHVIPILSVEGTPAETDRRRGAGIHARVLAAMAELERYGVFFGFSAMVPRQNLPVVSREDFLDDMIGRGCRIGYFVGYVPADPNTASDWIPDPEEQQAFRRRIEDFRRRKRIMIIHMPDDEYAMSGSCMAAGRGFLHVNAQGWVEPCPFAHVAADSVREGGLHKALASGFLATVRDYPGLAEKPRLGCALYEHREDLRGLAEAAGAKPTE